MYIEMKKTGLDVSDLITLVQRRKDGNTLFPYKRFVCRCSNCLYSTKGKCALKECCCMEERIRAHTCTFGEMMRYCFSGIADNVFQFRLRIAVEREAEVRSCFLDSGHRKRFYEGLAYTRKVSENFMAQIFLLSAYEPLWNETKRSCVIYSDLKLGTEGIAMFTKKGGIGGADIKLSTAAALSLGFYGGAIGYMIGLVFAIVFQTIYNKVKKQSNKKAFPLLPFLSTGLMIGYFI